MGAVFLTAYPHCDRRVVASHVLPEGIRFELERALKGGSVFYGGPDQIIPIASALSTIFGVALIYWGKLMNLYRKIIGAPRPSSTETQDKPQA